MAAKEDKPAKIPFSQRPEWADIQPVPQAEGEYVLVPILYPADYKEAMDYFRGIVKADEYSPRVLELTEVILRMNPAHYSVWQYRYQTLLRTNSSLEEELRLMDKIAAQNLKNYQVWHHRRLLQLQVRDPFKELIFVTKALKPEPLHLPIPGDDDESSEKKENPCDDTKHESKPTHKRKGSADAAPVRKNGHGVPADTKNYHTWAYRQWLLSEFNQPELWAGELDFVEGMLHDDVRNNSAWHHRFFVVWDSGVREGEVDREAVLRREIDYVKDKISIAPNNASPWNYLRGVLQRTHTPFSTLEKFIKPYKLPQSASSQASSSEKSRGPGAPDFKPSFMDDPPKSLSTAAGIETFSESKSKEAGGEETLDLDDPPPSSTASLPAPLAIEFMADIYLEKAFEAKETDKTAAENLVKQANELFESLATEHDTIRKRYWDYRQRLALKSLAPP